MEIVAYPGKPLLKAVGIALIVYSSIVIVISLLMLLTGGTTSSMDAATLSEMLQTEVEEGAAEAIGGTFIAFGLMMLIPAIYELIVGILGVKNCAKLEKARTLLVLGVVSLVLSGSSLYMSGDWTALIGIALIALYCLGAYRNMKAAPAAGGL